MAKQQSKATKTTANTFTVKAFSEAEKPDIVAGIVTRPEVQAGLSLLAYQPISGEGTTLDALVKELTKQCASGTDGDLSQGERMLVAQAHTLDAIFGECTRRARANMGEYTQSAELYLRVGLRAQAQCRATWETLAHIKNPLPKTFVRQANIAAGPQQVNNGQVLPRADEWENTPNKLLETTDGQRLDVRTPGTTIPANPQLETVGTLNRSKD